MNLDKYINIEKQESEEFMGFALAEGIRDKVIGMVRQDYDCQEARIIPDSNGLVLVKDGSKACLDRKASREVLMIPVRLKGKIADIPYEFLFFVCTK